MVKPGETSFVAYLQQLMDKYDFKQTHLAKSIGVSKSYMGDVFSGRSKPFTLDRCDQIADAMGVTKEEKKALGDLALIERSNQEVRNLVAHSLQKKSSQIIQLSSDPADYTKIPVLGKCPASPKSWMTSDIDGYQYFPKEVVKNRRLYLIRAAGDSMNKAGIDDGDLVIVDADKQPSNGKIVVICIDHEFTMKRFFRLDDQVTLMPDSHNPNHAPTVFDAKKCDILLRGVVEAVHWKKIK